MVSLRSFFYYKYDHSTRSFEPVALHWLNYLTLGILAHFIFVLLDKMLTPTPTCSYHGV